MTKLLCLALGVGLSPWLAAAGGATQRHATLTVLNEIHLTNQTEVQLGQLAQEKGTTLQVRGLGETLVRDHQNADQAVAQLARRSGMGLTSHLATAPEVRQLKLLSGTDFDKAFAQTLIKDHQTDMQKLLSEKDALPSSDVRELVMNFLPTLQKHLEWAENIHG